MMNISREPYIYSENKYALIRNKLAFKGYSCLESGLKKAFTQVKFRDYLDWHGFNTVADFIKQLSSQDRRDYINPTKFNKERFEIEERSRYWYNLSKGQPITSLTTTFYVNDAVGLYNLFGCNFSFWQTLNSSINISFSAYLLPDDLQKQIFIKHKLSRHQSPEQFTNNTKRLYEAQLEKLYSDKSIDSLHALTLLFIGHHFRSGQKQSKKVEKYLYAQFLFLMVYKYKIKNIGELFVHFNFLLKCNSIYKEDAENRLINFDQIKVDHAVVVFLSKSVKSLTKKEQEKIVSQKIMTYLNEKIHHPLFHAYTN